MVRVDGAVKPQPVPYHGEWNVSTKFLECALAALDTATVYVSFGTHPIATGIGLFLGLPRSESRSLRVRPDNLESEITRRENLVWGLAWRSLQYMFVCGHAAHPNQNCLPLLIAINAGISFSSMLNGQFVLPRSVTKQKKTDEIAEVPAKNNFNSLNDDDLRALRTLFESLETHPAQEGFVDLDPARQSQIDLEKRDHGTPSKTSEENRVGEVAASPNSQDPTEPAIEEGGARVEAADEFDGSPSVTCNIRMNDQVMTYEYR